MHREVCILHLSKAALQTSWKDSTFYATRNKEIFLNNFPFLVNINAKYSCSD